MWLLVPRSTLTCDYRARMVLVLLQLQSPPLSLVSRNHEDVLDDGRNDGPASRGNDAVTVIAIVFLLNSWGVDTKAV